MKNYLKHIMSIMVCIGLFACIQKLHAEELPQKLDKKEEIKQGLSINNPIVCKDIKDIEQVKKFIKKYIKENYPDYRVIATILKEDYNERSIEVWALEKGKDDNVENIDIHFDIEDAMIEFRKKNKRLIDELVKDVQLIYD